MSTSGVLQMVPIQLQWERTLKAMDDVRELRREIAEGFRRSGRAVIKTSWDAA